MALGMCEGRQGGSPQTDHPRTDSTSVFTQGHSPGGPDLSWCLRVIGAKPVSAEWPAGPSTAAGFCTAKTTGGHRQHCWKLRSEVRF